jgi:hypothetical protein
MSQAGVAPRKAGPASPLAVETRTIDYIPRGERHGRPWHLGALWFVANAELISFATGPIGIGLGLNFAWTAVAIILGTLIGTLAMAFHSAEGPRLGLAQMIQSRPVRLLRRTPADPDGPVRVHRLRHLRHRPGW